MGVLQNDCCDTTVVYSTIEKLQLVGHLNTNLFNLKCILFLGSKKFNKK